MGRQRDRSRPRASRSGRGGAPAPVPPEWGRTGVALWAVLAAMALLRLTAPAVPGTWLWGLDTLRYLPAWAWLSWAAAAAALLPPVGRVAIPAVEALGGRLERGVTWPVLVAAAAAAFLLLLPDRAHFAGDALLRFDAAREGVPAGSLSPQALPLDVWLHSTLPSWADRVFGLEPALASRLVGAADGAALALLAVAFARRLGLRGAALVAAAALAWWGGWLALFTGFAKAFSEMAVAVAAVAVFGLDALRGRRLLPLAMAGAAALFLHRSALGLLPAVVIALAVGIRVRVGERPDRRVLVSPGLAVLVLGGSLAVTAPQVIGAMRAFDAAHFTAAGEGAGAALTGWFAPLRLLDLANQLLFLVPLVALLALPAGRQSRGGPAPDRREQVLLLALTLPLAVALFLLRPAQGIARDFDDYAAGAVAVALLAAWRAGAVLRAAPGAAWLTAAILAGAAAPTAQYLLLQADLPRSLTRAEALAQGPPRRSENERAQLWDYLGGRRFRAGDYTLAARDLGRAAALAPSPRLLLGWAHAAGRAGDWEAAEEAYGRLLARAPADDPGLQAVAWYGLAGAALEARDDLVAGRARLERALQLRPDYPEALRLLAQVEAAERRQSEAKP